MEERLAWGQMGGRALCYEALEVGQVKHDVRGLS